MTSFLDDSSRVIFVPAVHLLERVHVDSDRCDRLLVAHLRHDRPLRQGLVRDGETSEGTRTSSGRKESQQQKVRFEVRRPDPHTEFVTDLA